MSTDRSTDSPLPNNRDDGTEAMAAGDQSGQTESKEQDEQQQQEEELDPEIMSMSSEEIRQYETRCSLWRSHHTVCYRRTRMIESDVRIMKSEIQRIRHESDSQKEKIKENQDKIKLNKQLPYLVGNVVEVLQLEGEEEEEEDGMAQDVDAQRTGKSVVIRTSTRQTIYLPVPGLVDAGELVPGDLVGTNKDSYLILEKLPAEYDSRVKAMEVDEKPSEEYSDIGGADKQITELVEAVVLPMTHKEMFDAIGIRPPKGVLLHGPPGTGKFLSVHCFSCLKGNARASVVQVFDCS